MSQHPQELLEQLRQVLSSALDAPVELVPGTMGVSGWRVRIIGPASAVWAITFETDSATEITRVLTPAGSTAPQAVGHTVHELCNHAIAAVAGQPGEPVPDVRVEPARFIERLPAHGATVAGLRCESLGITLNVSLGRDAAVAGDGPVAARVPGSSADSPRFSALMDIDLPMTVRFGCTDMSIKALSQLGPGSLIDLSRAPDDPVEVIVGGRVVARGEVVVVSGSYGIRIVEVGDGRAQARGVEA
jgi:flagellar motor switch protein FliN